MDAIKRSQLQRPDSIGDDESSNTPAVYVAGVLLVLVVVLAAASYFSILISFEIFLTIALIVGVVMLLAAYFSVLRVRHAAVYLTIAGLLTVAVLCFGSPQVDKGQYQAVFMTNGQVYFGKLQNGYATQPVLTDVYYLQSNQSPQSGEATEEQPAEAQPALSLIKLGEELHGPTDRMMINKEQVLFWENLKDDSQVVKAINEEKKAE